MPCSVVENKRPKKKNTWLLGVSHEGNYTLVVEETNLLLHKGHVELAGHVEDQRVVLAATRGGNVLDARPCGAVDVVDEWELKEIG